MIRFDDWVMPAASMGKRNPLPDIKNVSYIHAGYVCSPKISEVEKRFLGKGMIDTMLPYQLQDGYDRNLQPRRFKAAIIENEHLRAVFLPELGARLWSLFDKDLNRELLYVNSVFQPGNLGLRNAWFSGGVEFNVGIKGHNPLTCDPLFCEVSQTPQGEVLSFYEYERIRGVVYTISAWLPDHSSTLYLRCRIENRSADEKHMYWWSNIAVPENQGTRIIVPTDESFLCCYNEDHYELDKIKIPYAMETDVSYPLNMKASHDFFYKIPEDTPKWIAAVQPDGVGLLQCSTDRQKGRKLFVWGNAAGGRNWNEFLSEPGQAYIEIQAGLAHTQLEHIPMPAKTEWSWVEGYTALVADPNKLHGTEWNEAVSTVNNYLLDKVGDPGKMTFPEEETVISRKIIYSGSGWGGLEMMVEGRSISHYHSFPIAASDNEIGPWLTLLRIGEFPERDLLLEPESFVVGKHWIDRLEKAKDGWFKFLMLGVALYADKRVDDAMSAWIRSIEIRESPWALRNIAMVYKNEYHIVSKAMEYIIRAWEMKPASIPLAVECAAILTEAENHQLWLQMYDSMPENVRNHGRIRLYRAVSLIALDRLEEAVEIINPSFMMSDIKEGELSVSQIWFYLYRKLYAQQTGTADDAAADAQYPLPKNLDFRMHGDRK